MPHPTRTDPAYRLARLALLRAAFAFPVACPLVSRTQSSPASSLHSRPYPCFTRNVGCPGFLADGDPRP